MHSPCACFWNTALDGERLFLCVTDTRHDGALCTVALSDSVPSISLYRRSRSVRLLSMPMHVSVHARRQASVRNQVELHQEEDLLVRARLEAGRLVERVPPARPCAAAQHQGLSTHSGRTVLHCPNGVSPIELMLAPNRATWAPVGLGS